MNLVETLAKAMYISAGFSDWDMPPPGMLTHDWEAVRNAWMSHARAALEALHIPEKSGPVNVGEAVRLLGIARASAFGTTGNLIDDALRNLGVEVV